MGSGTTLHGGRTVRRLDSLLPPARPRPGPTRREFLQTLAGVVAAGAETLAMQTPGPAGIPHRPLGTTGASIPIVGYGGWDSVAGKTDAESVALMHEAIDLGITFWDNAWEYHRGRSETVMGQAFDTPARRDKVFLMTKVCARDYEGAKRQIDECLRRLRTDRVDLLQFHAIQYDGDADRVCHPEAGGLKAALEAKQAGKLRFLGFSGHMYPQVHLKLLGMHAWNAVQMPLNVLDAHYLSFEKTVVPEVRKRGAGVLGMKSLGGQDARIPRDLGVSVELCRRYAMSLPVSTTICGMQNRDELHQMAAIARGFTPLTADEVSRLLTASKAAAADGHIEEYKNPRGGYGCSYHSEVLKSAAR
jgi:predicted aldo/keto reductase-like oxidoreductase